VTTDAENGRLLTSTQGVHVGQRVASRLALGTIISRVEDVDERNRLPLSGQPGHNGNARD